MRRGEKSINNDLVTTQGYERDILVFAEGQKWMTHSADSAVQQIVGIMRLLRHVFI